MPETPETYGRRPSGLIVPANCEAEQDRRIREAAQQAEKMVRVDVYAEYEMIRLFFASQHDDKGDPDFERNATILEVGRWGNVSMFRFSSDGRECDCVNDSSNIEELCVQLSTARNVARHVFGEKWRKE